MIIHVFILAFLLVTVSYGNLVYSDRDIIAYNKQPNVLSVPGLYDKDSLASQITETFRLPRIDQVIVHRLDFHTSGIIIFARNEFALKNLHEQFRSKQNPVYKRYSAIVQGRMETFGGEIDIPLNRDPDRGSPFNKVDTFNGKPSTTIWNARGYVNNNT